jgi:ABC-2 type transport system ATP-binding protein
MIRCNDFSKKYKSKEIILPSCFETRSNKISFLMGKNGSGKTTLLKCMMGMEEYKGEFLFDGKKVDSVREQCLVLWDDCPFYQSLNGLDNLLIFSEGRKTKNEIIEMSQAFLDVDLLHSKVSTYSYGQKKKLSLCLVDILSPRYIFMDEISNGLDFETMRELKVRLKNWAKKSCLFLTGHQFDFYNGIIEDLFIFKNKQIEMSAFDFIEDAATLEDIYDKELC